MLRRRLEHETYLEQGKTTIDGIAEMITINEFEYRLKREFDYTDRTRVKKRFFVNASLRDDSRKGFEDGCIIVLM
jgi:hypothetical protein